MRTKNEILKLKGQARASCDAIVKATGEGGMTPEQTTAFERAAKDVDELQVEFEAVVRYEDMKREEAAEERAAKLAADEAGKQGDSKDESDYRAVFEKVILRGKNSLTRAETQIYDQRHSLELRGTATQSTQSDGLGGFTVPTEYDKNLVRVMKSYSGLMQAGNIITTNNGAPMLVTVSDQTLEEGAVIGENDADIVKDFSVTQKTLGALVFTSRIIKVSKPLLEDSFIGNFQTEVADLAAERIGRHAERLMTLGGSGITGLVPATTEGHQAALVDGISYDDVIELIHSVNSAYRPKASLMFSDEVLKTLRKLKDSEGRPIWQPSLIAGTPSTICGVPYFINDMLASMAADAKTMLYGDFSKYRIRMVKNKELVVLREKYAEYRAIGFNLFQRMDGLLVDTAAIKHLAMASA